LVALAVTTKVEGDDGVIGREARQVVGEILLRPTEAVHHHEPGAGALDDRRELHPVVGTYPSCAHATSYTPATVARHAHPRDRRRATRGPVRSPWDRGGLSSPGLVETARRPGWKFWLRLGVSAVVLTLLVLKVRDDLGPIFLRHHHVRTSVELVLAVALTFVGIVLSAWRWQTVLRGFDIHVPLRTLTGHYL